MAVEHLVATLRSATPNANVGMAPVNRGPVVLDATVAVTAAASATSTYEMMRIPSNARIHGISRVWWDDLASTGSPTLDIGLKAVGGNVTTDADALNDGLDAATVNSTGVSVIKATTHELIGKQAWEYVSGQTSDPGGFLIVLVSILDADTNTGGDISMTLFYTVD